MATNPRQAVRNLANARGIDGEIFEELFGLAVGTVEAADRGLAIVGAALLEDVLRHAISEHLAPWRKPGDHDALFEGPEAPLGGLAQRTRMAFSLGIITEEIKADLDDIRIIRIAFAHTPTRVTFSTPDIVKLLNRLNALAFLHGEALAELEKLAKLNVHGAKFATATSSLCGALSLGVPFWHPQRSLARALKVSSLNKRPQPDPSDQDNPNGPPPPPAPPPQSSQG